MLKIVSMLSVENIFAKSERQSKDKEEKKKRFLEKVCSEGDGDHIAFLKIFKTYEKHHFSKGR